MEELSIDSVLGLFSTINITPTRGVSIGAYGDFENWRAIFYFCIYRPEILHTPSRRQYAQIWVPDFWISSPKKIGAPLNFAFALRPIGRKIKISNRLYSSFRNCFGLIFSYILARRRESLVWDFRELKIPLTRFISIFVSFTPPLIFLEPLKLARWNCHRACTDDGANFVLSHRWLAPIGAKRGGSKYVVNFGIFKNHSGGPRGGQISTGRFQIYTYGGGWPFT